MVPALVTVKPSIEWEKPMRLNTPGRRQEPANGDFKVGGVAECACSRRPSPPETALGSSGELTEFTLPPPMNE